MKGRLIANIISALICHASFVTGLLGEMLGIKHDLFMKEPVCIERLLSCANVLSDALVSHIEVGHLKENGQ